ncbi:MAG: CsbD family protein [Deltaproteobacteria bacterium]|nr:CsbD family protein [Deltaproteobacteria bacterium]
MDKKNLEGDLDQAKGRVKEGVGGLAGNRDLEAEGRADQTKGKVKDALGNLRDRAKDALDDIDRKK